jgi:serine/threonine-protein kinase
MSAALGRAARAAIAIGGTSNAAAQNLYLKSKAQLKADDSEASWRSGISLLDSAIALDPKFADAYALKARALADLNGFFTEKGGRFEAGYVQAAAVAQQAISLAPNLPAGHMALAYIRLSQLDVGASAVEFERGYSVAGGDADDLLAYAIFTRLIGKADEALSVARQAQNRDPLNAAAYVVEAGILARPGYYQKAADAYRKALALAPNLKGPRAFLGLSLVEIGKHEEASTELAKVAPDNLLRLVVEAILFAREGNRAASDAALQHAQRVYGDVANFQYAEVYAQRGEKDRAFAALDRAWNYRDPGLAWLKADASLAPLRSDPRFTVLLRKMNFPAA